jgi:pimeloyl-ACP methyl ester carboxylesterase
MIAAAVNKSVHVPVGNIELPGEINLPEHAPAFVIFSHGSGSSRFSPRNQFIAGALREKGIGTFLFDLLTKEEDQLPARFNIELLTSRLLGVTAWALEQAFSKDLTVGYFGASTGAAAALTAAAQIGERVQAVVSRGGRPDLALPYLPEVKAATLLIVGDRDEQVLEWNEGAYMRLHDPKELVIIPGAGHLFEEPGKLAEVAEHASEWFSRHLLEAVV